VHSKSGEPVALVDQGPAEPHRGSLFVWINTMASMKSLKQAKSVFSYVWRHQANRGSRPSAIVRALVFQFRGRVFRKSTVTSIGESLRMHAVLHHAASSKVLYSNPPDWNEMIFWRRALRAGEMFIDVGSNVGSYALWAADCSANVIAVEPDPNAVDLLRINLSLNPLVSVRVEQCALGAAPGEISMTSGLDTMNRLVIDGTGDQMVRVRTLDALIDSRRVRGVKIDVEGAERLVLEGAINALQAHLVDFIQLEWNSMSRDVLGEDRIPTAAILESCGYSFFRPDGKGRLHPATKEISNTDIFAVSPRLRLRASTLES
jgi:FkbM family methyltransferase